jgi:hypothetical protein
MPGESRSVDPPGSDGEPDAIERMAWMEACVAENAGVLALTDPPAHCPACLAEAGAPWPVGATSRHCAEHLEQLRRRQCKGWNASRAHQVMAGQATFAAFSARWRAEQGMALLSAEAVRKYLRPELIRSLGVPLSPELQVRIYWAWSHGYLYGVLRWIHEPAWAREVDAALDRAERGWGQSTLALAELGETREALAGERAGG